MSILPSSRATCIFLALVLSFIAGLWAQANGDQIKRVVGEVYTQCVCPSCECPGGQCEKGGCCKKAGKEVKYKCECKGCEGKCAVGKCKCDPLDCMSGCKAWCPGISD